MRCGKILVIAALVFSTGLHWATLQTVAWATMVAANLSSQQSFTEAVSQTFDGQHPCSLCKAIAAGKKSENKSEAPVLKLKLEFPPVAKKFVLISPAPVRIFCAPKISADSFSAKPPVPPPRPLCV